VLLEPHVAAEETKQGFSSEELADVFEKASQGSFGHVQFKGVMGMATFTDDESVVRSDFAQLRDIFDKLKSVCVNDPDSFTELSIGMSDDYHIAIEYGSTMIRIGSMIFGERV
jgi:uncharacterized pyridoxal phosphate-containing UPF0001 family protein